MNKNDLIAEVADRSGLSKADATKAVDYVFDIITASLKKGEEVRLVGFGTFNVSSRAATEGGPLARRTNDLAGSLEGAGTSREISIR